MGYGIKTLFARGVFWSLLHWVLLGESYFNEMHIILGNLSSCNVCIQVAVTYEHLTNAQSNWLCYDYRYFILAPLYI